MLKEWQFNVLFWVGVGSAVLLLIGPELGFDVGANPTSAAGVGAILTYILTQKKALTKDDAEKKAEKRKREEDGDGTG